MLLLERPSLSIPPGVIAGSVASCGGWAQAHLVPEPSPCTPGPGTVPWPPEGSGVFLETALGKVTLQGKTW